LPKTERANGDVVAADLPSVLVLLGPTATGKTAIGVEVALRLGGEVVSADSRAFLIGLDVVTDTPTPEERRGVPHHLIDCVSITEPYDAMAFRRDVAQRIPEILQRNRVPLVVGGGTLYLGAILRGIFEGPGKDERLRGALAAQPSTELHQRLVAVDPVAASTIHPNDRLRITRALEVYEQTERPISEWQAEAEPLPYAFAVFGLKRDRDDHHAAIAARVRRMIEVGLVDEVSRLRERGLRPGFQAYRTIGVPEAMAFLDGQVSESKMERDIVRGTWALARRQMAWFRREAGVRWVDVTGRREQDVAAEIVERWGLIQEDER
jgi:tRNA dimethylallyltransferase